MAQDEVGESWPQEDLEDVTYDEEMKDEEEEDDLENDDEHDDGSNEKWGKIICIDEFI